MTSKSSGTDPVSGCATVKEQLESHASTSNKKLSLKKKNETLNDSRRQK